ncbi:MAG: transposase [Coriobacteriales bacterium]|jgi:transposase|nr:transposase [Coriobacteriales bacterium]
MGYCTAIGLDVHARSIKACALDTATGELVQRTFPYDGEVVGKWAQGFKAPVGLVYESGCMGFGLSRTLNACDNLKCIVGAVSKMYKPPADRKGKTDKRDATFLARLLASGNITPVYVPTEHVETLRDLSRARADALSCLKHSIQQLSGFLMRHGMVWKERTPKGKLKKAWYVPPSPKAATLICANSSVRCHGAMQELVARTRNLRRAVS